MFFFFLLILLFIFFFRSLLYGVRSCERCKKAWQYVIHLVVCVTIFLNTKICFWLSLHLVNGYVWLTVSQDTCTARRRISHRLCRYWCFFKNYNTLTMIGFVENWTIFSSLKYRYQLPRFSWQIVYLSLSRTTYIKNKAIFSKKKQAQERGYWP